MTEFEKGVRAGIEALIPYFQDENENPLHAELPNRILEMHAEGALLQALADHRQDELLTDPPTDDDHAFQGVVTKLRTTKGSPFAREVMDEAADRIEDLKRRAVRAEALLAVWGMSAMLQITDAQIEAAAKAMLEVACGPGAWDHREPLDDDLYRRRARAALEAARGQG